MPTKTKGHWPRGKRRNEAARLLIARTKRVLAHPVRGKVSLRAAAAKIGVAPRTLARWIAGEDFPTEEGRRRWEAWLGSLATAAR